MFFRVEWVELSAPGVASLPPFIPPRVICVENSGNSVALASETISLPVGVILMIVWIVDGKNKLGGKP